MMNIYVDHGLDKTTDSLPTLTHDMRDTSTLREIARHERALSCSIDQLPVELGNDLADLVRDNK